MIKATRTIIIAAVVLLLSLSIILPDRIVPVHASGPTTSVTITKYDADGTTILGQETVDYVWMSENLPMYGDGATHYYHQGPSFDNSSFDALWNPAENVNWDSRDYGAVIGTDIMDLCELAGGASAGDVIKVASADGFSKSFDYEDVYSPEPEQGRIVLTWYTESGIETTGDGFVPDYSTGMRLVFFAGTTNSAGKYVFGNWDMHETLAEDRWHYYYDGEYWPSSSGLSVKWVSDIKIYTSGPDTYNLTISSDDGGNTTPGTGSHAYSSGTVVTITAVPESGWQFVNWTGASVADPDSASTTVTMDSNKTVTANFTQSPCELTIEIDGNGSTMPVPGDHTCAQGDVVYVTAVPDSGWQFVNWTGDDITASSALTISITMDDDKTITANFTKETQKLTIKVEGSGTTTPAAGSHVYGRGATVDIKAVPDSGWEFAGWTGDVADNGSASSTVIMSADREIVAKFTQVTCNLTIKSDGSGSVTPASGSYSYAQNKVVTITAVPADGWEFISWTGDVADAGSPTTTITMNGNKGVTAQFARKTTISSSTGPVETDDVSEPSSETGGRLSTTLLIIIAAGIIMGIIFVAGIIRLFRSH